MTDAELAHTKELAFFMVERVFMNPISAKLLSEDWRKEFPDEVAVAERMKALVEALEKAQAKNALVAGGIEASTKLHERIGSLTSENAALKGSVENASGCINAAYAEGLIDVLAESSDERLVDLVKRRLLHAYLPVETPATDDVLVAMGDAVLLEQLECGGKAIISQSNIIGLQANRIAELESRTVTAAAADVLAERQRQVTAEGWTAERDDGYQNSELADAAACYAIHAHNQGFSTPAHWPWSQDWWKQTSPRRDLVKAGALILAEIERLDRAAGIKVEAE
ncbi:hypothetical protein [Klebsiella pasteurii]|uniref:hypothetical protein n=1 Tax=Klebsiella pasteurii TaxID=2587529 RepID=UPI00293149C5|nr:hypothetical protein [Klebsiella pasteurii]